MRCEILMDGVSRKAIRILDAMASRKNAPIPITLSSQYTGRANILMLWGCGRSDHKAAWQAHREKGGHCIGFDIGYFDRPDSVRVHINANHPTAEQLFRTATYRARRNFELRNDYDANGAILLIGQGRKSANAAGMQPEQWERETYAKLRAEFPKKRIEYRPKYRIGKFKYIPDGMMLAPDCSIEDALRGKSLVVCKHSNVAIDATIAGVPVRCEDGAAYTLYKNSAFALRDERLQFLNAVEWFNWHHTQAREIWNFVLGLI